jgi:hypothetical protein
LNFSRWCGAGFPRFSVIAMSGAYHSGEAVPGGVIADAFYPKGPGTPETLLRIVADLIQTSAAHAVDHKRESAPVWIPRNGKDSHGIPFVVLTCTDCLRSFPLSVMTEDLQKIQETPCLFCPNTVRYIIDFSIAVASPRGGGGEDKANAALSAMITASVKVLARLYCVAIRQSFCVCGTRGQHIDRFSPAS